MFADTGIPLLFEAMYALGCKKADLVVKITGAGKIYEDHGTFQIGTRNYDVARKLLTHNRVRISREDVGGAKSRTPRLFVETGRLVISSLGKEAEL